MPNYWNQLYIGKVCGHPNVLFEHFISNYTSFASTLLGRISTRSWICSNSYIRASEVRWCWVLGSGSHSVKIIPKVFNGILLWLLCRPVKLFHIRFSKSIFMDPALCTGRPSHAKIEKALQTVGTTLKAYNSLESRCIQQICLHWKYRNSQNC